MEQEDWQKRVFDFLLEKAKKRVIIKAVVYADLQDGITVIIDALSGNEKGDAYIYLTYIAHRAKPELGLEKERPVLMQEVCTREKIYELLSPTYIDDRSFGSSTNIENVRDMSARWQNRFKAVINIPHHQLFLLRHLLQMHLQMRNLEPLCRDNQEGLLNTAIERLGAKIDSLAAYWIPPAMQGAVKESLGFNLMN